jgi:ATP-dependent RNA circularization protein (DNA/RNA ligase family)
LRTLFPYYAIQGEICGPSIQKNLLGLKTVTFHVFNIVDLRYRRPLGYDEMCEVTDKMGLERVGFVEQGDVFGYTTIKELLVLAQGKYPKTNNEREGIVIRSKDRKISFKVINNNYLIKNDY